MMSSGFVLASRLRARIVIALGLALEIFTACMIRDNLTLNVIMLLHPFEAIKQWQSGPPII